MLLLLILVACSCSNAAPCVAGNELLRLKRPPTAPGPHRFLHQSKSGATILEMRHSKYLQKGLILDDVRVESIQSRIRNVVSGHVESSQARVPISSGVKLQTLNYIVTVTLGGRNLTVIVDTGSDLSWVQCQPCRLCYVQPEPLFNPLASPSYSSVQCDSEPCHILQSNTGNTGLCGSNAPKCNYAVTYGDGSYTRGELGRDRLTLGTTPVEGFVFGCGRNNRGLFGAASGLMGLGRSDLSLISQTSDVFGGVFSYCLPDSDSGTSGSLILGNDTSVFKNTTPVSYTRLVPNPQLSSFYILNMTGASVGGVPLQSPSFGGNGNGVLIDSGTVITRLPPSVYSSVKAEFLRQFTGYPSAPSFSILDTCFNLSAYEEVNIPTLKMQFEGDAEMSVDVTGMFYFVKRDASQVCLALTSLACIESYEDMEFYGPASVKSRSSSLSDLRKRILLGDIKETRPKHYEDGIFSDNINSTEMDKGSNILIIEVHQLQTNEKTKGIVSACSPQMMLYIFSRGISEFSNSLCP